VKVTGQMTEDLLVWKFFMVQGSETSVVWLYPTSGNYLCSETCLRELMMGFYYEGELHT